MPLTRGDKYIIIGAVVLAVSVVAGLAVWKKPHLFGLGAAPRIASDTAPAAPAVPAPGTATAPAAPAGAAAIAPPPTSAAPAKPGQTSPAPQVPAIPPLSVEPPLAAAPVEPLRAETPAGPGKAPPPVFKGDETLDKMFAQMGQESSQPIKEPAKAPVVAAKPGEPGPVPLEPALAVPTPALDAAPKPDAAPAETAAPPAKPGKPGPPDKDKTGKDKAEADKTDKKKSPDTPAAAATAAEPNKAAAPAAKPTKVPAAAPAQRGSILRVVGEDTPGEFVLTVETSAPPAHFEKMFLSDPPRVVLDLDGAWAYNGPLDRPVGEGVVRRIRVGKHADRFRVVLDLGPEAANRLRGAPSLDRSPSGVVLRLAK